MDNEPAGAGPQPKKTGSWPRPSNAPILFLLVMVLLVWLSFNVSNWSNRSEISYGLFLQELDKNNIETAQNTGAKLGGEFKQPPTLPVSSSDKEHGAVAEPLHKEFTVVLSPLAGEDIDVKLREKLGVNYKAESASDGAAAAMFIWLAIPVLFIVAFLFMMRRARDQFLGGGILSGFSKSPAKRYEVNAKRITFADVAGLEGVKNDLSEVVEF